MIIRSEQLAKKISHEQPFLLDVRDEPASAEELGYLDNVHHIPLSDLASRWLELEHEREREGVVICRSGKQAAFFLKHQGFKRIFVLSGGCSLGENRRGQK